MRQKEWRFIDWRLQNWKIAKLMNADSSVVSRVRRALRAGPAPNHGRRSETATKLAEIQRRTNEAKGLSMKEAAKLFGFSPSEGSPAFRFLKCAHVLRPAKRRPWGEMNFKLPDRTLERIWQLPPNAAWDRRHRKRLGKPKWNIQDHRIVGLKKSGEYAKYVAAVCEEKRKARRYPGGYLPATPKRNNATAATA